MDEKKCNKKLAKIHGHKSNKKYKKLLKSYDPILNNNELVKALSDPEDKIGINDKLFDALGKHIIIVESELIGIDFTIM